MTGTRRRRVAARRLRACTTGASSSRCSRRAARTLRINPPHALTRAISTPPGDPQRLAIRRSGSCSSGPQTARHNDHDRRSGSRDAVHAPVEPDLRAQAAVRLDPRVTYNGNHVIGTLKYSLENLPLSPLNGPVMVVNHPNNAPAAGFPDLRGRDIDRLAADLQCAGTGLPGVAVERDLSGPVPIADNEISLRVRAPTSAGPIRATRRTQGQQRRRVLVRRRADRVEEALQQGTAVPAELHAKPVRRHASEATFVGAGDIEQPGRTRATRGGTRASTPRIGSPSTAATSCRSGATGRTCSAAARRLAGLGVIKLASGTPFTVTSGHRSELRRLRGRAARFSLDPSVMGAPSTTPRPAAVLLARRRSGDTTSATASTRSCRVTPSTATASTPSTRDSPRLQASGGQAAKHPHRGLQHLPYGPVPRSRRPTPRRRRSVKITSTANCIRGPSSWAPAPVLRLICGKASRPSGRSARPREISRAWRTGRLARWRRASTCGGCSISAAGGRRPRRTSSTGWRTPGCAGTVATQGPRYFGFVVGGSLPVATAADWLVSAWDQNSGIYALSPLVSVVEDSRRVVGARPRGSAGGVERRVRHRLSDGELHGDCRRHDITCWPLSDGTSKPRALRRAAD